MTNKPTMQSNNEQEYGLTFKDLAAKFDISLKQAAKEFGMSVSMLKKKCRSLNVKQWPYRKVSTLGRRSYPLNS